MAKFGCPPRYIAMVRQFHDGMQARVQNNGEYSEPFPVTNGVKQGCVMAPTLFSMMFSAMLTDAFQDIDAGFPIRYRFDGKLLNLRRLQAKSKVQTDVVDKLLYADDLAENAKSEEKMQGAVDRMSKACDNFQLTISTKKTEVVHQPAPGKPYSEPTITVNGQKLQVVDKLAMSQECLMRGCQRKFSMENFKKESAHKVAKRNATKTPLKPRLRISIFQLSPGNRLLRI